MVWRKRKFRKGYVSPWARYSRKKNSRRALKLFRRTKGGRRKTRPVMNRGIRVKGQSRPLNTRPEMKYTIDRVFGPTGVLANTATFIWDCNSHHPEPQPGGGAPPVPNAMYVRAPTQGDDEFQYTGRKFNALYAEVRFIVNPMVPVNSGAPDEPGTINMIENEIVYPTFYRMIVARSRETGLGGVGYPALPANFTEPVYAKQWDIFMDKLFSVSIGQAVQMTLGGAATWFDSPPRTKPRMFKFKIPLKQSCTTRQLQVPNGAGGGVTVAIDTIPFTFPIIIVIITTKTNLVTINQMVTKFFFKDP